MMRRIAFPLAFFTVAMLGASAPARALEEVIITQPVDSLSFFPVYVARTLKYFEAEGLSPRVLSTSGGGPHLQAVLSGKAQFTASPGNYQLNALKSGQKLVGVVDLLNRCIIGVVMNKDTAKRVGLRDSMSFEQKIKLLKGLTLGITRPGALTDSMARQLLLMAGYKVGKDARILGVGGASTIVPALENHKIDVMFISTPHPERAIGGGFGVWLVNNAKGENPRLREFMMAELMTTPEYIESHAQTVQKVVRVMKRSLDYIHSHSTEDIVKTVEPFFGKRVKPPLLKASVETVKPATSRDGRLTEDELAATVRLLRESGRDIPDLKLKDVFTDRFLAAAH